MAAGERRRAARSGPDAAGRRAGDPVVRLLLTLTAVLAAGAAVVAVIGEDPAALRLGIVAALWSTLLAVTALVRRGARPDAAEVAAREAALRRAHEIEVERPAAQLERVEARAVPPDPRPWSSGAGARSVADLLAAHDTGARRSRR